MWSSASSAAGPVYLREVAEIVDGAEEPSNYIFFGHGAARASAPDEEPAVTLSIAKRPGANAISVAHEVLRKIETLKGTLIPRDVEVSITRNYGETAAEKSNELLLHMGIAVVGVSLLIWLHARLARIGHRRARHPGHARAHAARFLSSRLHAQPHHALRAHLLHRHPGR